MTQGPDIRELGTVAEIRRGIMRLHGLPSCVLGQLIEFGGGARGFVIGFTDVEVLALVLGREQALRVGQQVAVSQQPLRMPVGHDFLGRVVSALGEALDGDAAAAPEDWRPMFAEAPGILQRTPVERQLRTGIRAIDTMIPLGLGQRELILGDRMTGKTTLALDAMLSQQGQGVLCIYCSIGQSHQKLRQVVDVLRDRGALAYTAVVAAPASHEASEQFLAPYAAAALGEHFMAQGRDVLVVFDDLSKHAWAYRQLSLLLELPPGREAYPGDMFYMHAQLMERAGQLGRGQHGGSMTFLPICETQQGDVTGYISSNLISMTDGQLYLSSELFYEGLKPAIDVGLSVSRIGNKVQTPALRWATGSLRLDLLQYQELVRLTRFSAVLPENLAVRRRRGALLRRLMAQPAHEPMSLEDQMLLFYAFQTGRLDHVSEDGLAVCLRGLSGRVAAFAQDVLRDHPALTPPVRAKLDAALGAVLDPYTQQEATAHAV